MPDPYKTVEEFNTIAPVDGLYELTIPVNALFAFNATNTD
jgi:hypothetical protein